MKVQKMNESGYTLIGVLAIFTILSILGISLITISVTSFKTSTTERDDQSAFYIAEAGLNYKFNKVKNMVDNFSVNETERADEAKNRFDQELQDVLQNEKYNTFEKVNVYQPTANIVVEEITDSEEYQDYKLTSTGTIGSKERTVEQVITIQYENNGNAQYELPDMVLFADGTIIIKKDVKVNGNIGTLLEESESIEVAKDVSIGGDIRVPKGYTDRAVKTASNGLPVPVKMNVLTFPELLEFPTFPSTLPNKNNIIVDENSKERIIESQKVSKIELVKDSTLIFDVGDTDMSIVVDSLTMAKNSFIHLEGSGSLTLYIKDKIVINKESGVNHEGEAGNLNIFYKGIEPFQLEKDTQIKGSIFVEKADFVQKKDGYLCGNLFSGGNNVKFEKDREGCSQLVLAPHAEFSIEKDGKFKGIVIAKDIVIEKDVELSFDEPILLDGFISPSDPGFEVNNGDTNVLTSVISNPIRETEK